MAKKVTRYRLTWCERIDAAKDGEWVKYEDIKYLLSQDLLLKYGNHLPLCAALATDGPNAPYPCSCGLDAALSSAINREAS